MLLYDIYPEISIKNYLLHEKLLDYFNMKTYMGPSTQFYIYKNPTHEEWVMSVPPFARGWISPDGTLYIEGYERGMFQGEIIHYDLLKALLSKNIPVLNREYVEHYYQPAYKDYLYNIKKYGLLVQRQSNSETLMFSESMDPDDAYSTTKSESIALYKKLQSRPECRYIQYSLWNSGNENDEEEANPWGR